MSPQRPLVIGLAALLLLVTHTTAWAQKTDVVVLLNGDHYTCELKRLERGLLTVKTDDVGTLDIKWHRIASITSPTRFDVETDAGAQFVGTLQPGTRPASLDIVESGTVVTVETRDIVFMAPVKNRFRSRLTGSISVGFSFARANKKSDWSLDSDVGYRAIGHETHVTASSAYSKQEGASPASRNSGSVNTQHRLSGRWTYSGLLSLQQNTQLSLNLRAIGGGGAGRIFVRTNAAVVTATGGLAVSREYFEGEEGHTSLESFVQLRADLFRLDSPKVDLSTTYTLSPSLTDAGRIRSDLKASLKVEIFFKNFFFSINGFDTADTRPPQETISKHDYGITTSFGYSF